MPTVDPPGKGRQHEPVAAVLEADYLVVGAGAAGMAFTDALIDHADVSVVMVDRRHSVGGHWLDAYPFVRLHQASAFYGVASTLLGQGRVQQDGPGGRPARARAGAGDLRLLRPRAPRADDRRRARCRFYPGCDYLGDRRFVSRVSGKRYAGPADGRVVDARYLAPRDPGAARRRRSASSDGVRVVAVNDLVKLDEAPSQYVIVGSGKTATDACIWLLEQRGRPRRHLLGAAPRPVDAQPRGGPAGPGRLHRHGGGHPGDRGRGSVARRHVPRHGGSGGDAAHRPVRDAHHGQDADARHVGARPAAHDRERRPARAHPARASRAGWCSATARSQMAKDAVVVHCAAPGLVYPPLVPIWGEEAITLQPVRTGFPCFGAAHRRLRRGHASTATTRRTGCARRRRLRTRPPTGRGCRCWAVGRRCRSRPTPTSRPGPTGPRSTRRGFRRTWPTPPRLACRRRALPRRTSGRAWRGWNELAGMA